MLCAVKKTAEPMETQFGMWTTVAPRKHVWGARWRNLTNMIEVNRPYVAAMQPFCQITLTTCFLLLIVVNFWQI